MLLSKVLQRRYCHIHAYGYGRRPFWMLHFDASTRTTSSLGRLPDAFDRGFEPRFSMRQGAANVGGSKVSMKPKHIDLPT